MIVEYNKNVPNFISFSKGTNQKNTAVNPLSYSKSFPHSSEVNKEEELNDENIEDINKDGISISSYHNIVNVAGNIDSENREHHYIKDLDLDIPNPSNHFKPTKILNVTPSFLTPDLFINNKNIMIDENGLMSSPEDKRGKFTFFGIDPNPNLEEHQSDILVDLDNETLHKNNINKKFPLFYIVYDPKVDLFILKSLTKDFYFSLILTPFVQIQLDTQRKSYMKIGKVVVTITIKKEIEILKIKVRKAEFMKEKKVYSFNNKQCPITIGRANAQVIIKNESVSKAHVTIDYDKVNDKYFIVDNGSTNGSQLLLHEGKSIFLEGTMSFVLGNKQFKIEEKK